MNVLFLTRRFYPSIGGVETHVEKVSKELIKRGYQVTIITEQHDSSLELVDFYKDIKIYRIPISLIDTKFLVWQWIMAHRKVLTDVDVVHIHDVHWWIIPLLWDSTPRFMTFHGWEGHFPPTKKSIRWRSFAARTTAGSIAIGAYIPLWYKTRPNVITHGATDVELMDVGAKNKVLVLGRLSHDNDLDIVIEALTKIKHRLPQVKIMFLGDGELAWKAKEIGEVIGFKKDILTYLAQVKWVFASSYLSIYDAIAAGRSVFSVYSNQLKRDYFEKSPLTRGITICNSSEDLYQQFVDQYHLYQEHTFVANEVHSWILEQTWEKMTHHYIKLWENKHYKYQD